MTLMIKLNHLCGNLQKTKMVKIVEYASALQRDIDIMVMWFLRWEMLFNVVTVKSLITRDADFRILVPLPPLPRFRFHQKRSYFISS